MRISKGLYRQQSSQGKEKTEKAAKRAVSNRIFKQHIIELLDEADNVEALIFVHAFLKIHNQKDQAQKKLTSLLNYAISRRI